MYVNCRNKLDTCSVSLAEINEINEFWYFDVSNKEQQKLIYNYGTTLSLALCVLLFDLRLTE